MEQNGSLYFQSNQKPGGSGGTTPGADPGVNLPLVASNVTAVEFTNITSYNGLQNFGIGEVRLVGSSAPEPASLGLLAVAGAGLILRRRRLA